MTVSLDTVVSEVVYLAKTLEKAVHDPGPWTMTFGGRTEPAKRFEVDGGVVFISVFAEHCHLVPPEPRIVLECDMHPVAVKAIIFPGDGSFEVRWTVRAERVPLPVA